MLPCVGRLPRLPCLCCCSVWVWAPPGVFGAVGLFSLVLLPVLTTTQPPPKAPGSTQHCGHCGVWPQSCCLEHLWMGRISEAGREGTAQPCARRGCLATGASAEGEGTSPLRMQSRARQSQALALTLAAKRRPG